MSSKIAREAVVTVLRLQVRLHDSTARSADGSIATTHLRTVVPHEEPGASGGGSSGPGRVPSPQLQLQGKDGKEDVQRDRCDRDFGAVACAAVAGWDRQQPSLGVDRGTVRNYTAPGMAPGGPPLGEQQWAELVRSGFPELVHSRLRQSSWPAIGVHHDYIKGLLAG
jgi:hypothetical protein